MWKTEIVIWTDYDPTEAELDELAREATCGDAYCSKQHVTEVADPETDPDFQCGEFFDKCGVDTDSERAEATD